MMTTPLRSFFLGGLLGLAAVATAHARDCAGVSFPDQEQVEGSALTLNGLGIRKATMLKVQVYVAALYVVKPSRDPNAILGANAPTELIMHFVRDVDGKDIAGAWDEGFANNAKAQLPALKDRIATLNSWMTDMKIGQRMVFSFKPGAGLTAKVNGTVKGTIKGDDFAKAFLSLWLGAKPANSELKSGLLGGACA